MSEGDLRLEGVAVRYGREDPVLNDVDFAPSPGTMTAIVGASGSGKSSLLYIAGLLKQPAAGTVFVAGERVRRWSDRRTSRLRSGAVGFVFQDSMLNPRLTVLDNIVSGLVGSRVSTRAANRKAIDLMNQLEVDVPPSRTPVHMSGGQAQRIALARALIRRPRLVLADEPTGNLDAATAALVLTMLQHHATSEGATIVCVTHSDTVAAACDQTARIADRSLVVG